MIKQSIEEMISQVSKLVPENMSQFKDEFEKNVRATIEASFKKMELVTREEFDIQTALLQRTRTQLDELQKKLTELENHQTEE
jgi:BMFP domain-containing protein YqiC